MTDVRQILRELERDYQSLVAQVQTYTTQLQLQVQQSKHLETIRTRTLEGIRHISHAMHCLPDLAQAVMTLQQQADDYLSGLERQLDELTREQQRLQSERGAALRRIRQVKDHIRGLADTVSGYTFVALEDLTDAPADETESLPADSHKQLQA